MGMFYIDPVLLVGKSQQNEFAAEAIDEARDLKRNNRDAFDSKMEQFLARLEDDENLEDNVEGPDNEIESNGEDENTIQAPVAPGASTETQSFTVESDYIVPENAFSSIDTQYAETVLNVRDELQAAGFLTEDFKVSTQFDSSNENLLDELSEKVVENKTFIMLVLSTCQLGDAISAVNDIANSEIEYTYNVPKSEFASIDAQYGDEFLSVREELQAAGFLTDDFKVTSSFDPNNPDQLNNLSIKIKQNKSFIISTLSDYQSGVEVDILTEDEKIIIAGLATLEYLNFKISRRMQGKNIKKSLKKRDEDKKEGEAMDQRAMAEWAAKAARMRAEAYRSQQKAAARSRRRG